MIVTTGRICEELTFSISHFLFALLRTFLQEYLVVRYQTFLGRGVDRHVRTGNIEVSAIGGNNIGGIIPQFLRMTIDGKVG